MIVTKSLESWQIRKLEDEADLLFKHDHDDKEFVIFRTCLNKYKKDLEISFTSKKRFYKLSKAKQEKLKDVFESDMNKIEFLKYLWDDIREKRQYKCSECDEKTKYLFIYCTNLKYIKEFRAPAFKLLCFKCWEPCTTS